MNREDWLVAIVNAALDGGKEILEIYDMVPMSKASVCSKKNSAYALEVNKGWFKEHNISSGQFLDF